MSSKTLFEKGEVMIYLSAFADEAADSLLEQIKALKKNNIPYLELRTVDGIGVKDLTVQKAKEVKRILDENEIKVYSIGSPLGKVDISVDIEEYMNVVRHICVLANIFETTRVRVFSFFNAFEQREKVITYLNKMVAVAKEYGVELYHENEKDIYGDIAERVEDVLTNVNGLKSIYDPSNYLFCGQAPEQTAWLQKKTDYFHIKDSILGTCQIVPAGYGDGKIDELVANITEDKVLSIEPHLKVFKAFSQIDSTEMKHKYYYESNAEAFDAAVAALKDLLKKAGYKEINGAFVK